LLPQD